MSNLIDETVIALRIIAKLGVSANKGCKLYLKGNEPCIHRPGLFSWLYRGGYGESRSSTYNHVERVASTTFQLMEMLLNSVFLEDQQNQKPSTYQKQKSNETLDNLALLSRELDAALAGIDAMLDVYRQDGAFSSKLEVLKSKTQRVILTTQQAVEFRRKGTGAE